MTRSLTLIFALGLAAGWPGAAPAQVYVAYTNAGVISEYNDETGALIKETLVLGLNKPHGLCYADGMLFVVQRDSGYVGKFNATTGAPVNAELVPGLQMPQAIAISGDYLYVADFNWETGQAQVGKYNARTGATISAAFLTQLPSAACALAVSGNKLFVGFGDFSAGVMEFDATTGAVVNPKFDRMTGANALAQAGDTLWVAFGSNAPSGCVLKMDVATGAFTDSLGNPRPLVMGLDYPSQIAVAGDDLYIGTGPGTAIAKFNATTGEQVNANLIPSLGDRLGGIAVVPRDPSDTNAISALKFSAKGQLFNFIFSIATFGDYLAGTIFLIVVLLLAGLVCLVFRSPVPASAQTLLPEDEPVPSDLSTATQGTSPEHVVPANFVPTPSEHRHFGIVFLLVVLIVLLVVITISGYAIFQWAISSYIAAVHRTVVQPP